MGKYIACKDLMPGCGFTAAAVTEEELLRKVMAHAAQVHGITELTSELAAKVRSAIEDHVPAKVD